MTLEEINNYIEDGWDDNSITGRSNPDEGYFLHPSDNLLSNDYEAGDALKGVYRPEWTTQSGSPSASNGVLSLSAGDTTQQSILTPSEFTAGTWETDYKFTNTPSSGGICMVIMAQSTSLDGVGRPNNCYFGYNHFNGDYHLYLNNGGSATNIITTISLGVPESFATMKISRTTRGNFELFHNGTSQGTATDTTHTGSRYNGYGSNTDVSSDYDNLVVQ